MKVQCIKSDKESNESYSFPRLQPSAVFSLSSLEGGDTPDAVSNKHRSEVTTSSSQRVNYQSLTQRKLASHNVRQESRGVMFSVDRWKRSWKFQCHDRTEPKEGSGKP